MNTGNSKINEPHKFKLSLADIINLKDNNKSIALVNFSIYHKRKNSKSAYKNNKFKITPPTWNDEFNLTDKSYSV